MHDPGRGTCSRHGFPPTVQVVQFNRRVVQDVTNIVTSLEHQMAITKEAYHAEARCILSLQLLSLVLVIRFL